MDSGDQLQTLSGDQLQIIGGSTAFPQATALIFGDLQPP